MQVINTQLAFRGAEESGYILRVGEVPSVAIERVKLCHAVRLFV